MKWLFVILIATLLGATAAFLIWATVIPSPMSDAFEALNSNDRVEIENGDWLTFRPRHSESEIGVIFYPGARVDNRAYSITMKAIAERGYLVVVPRMPLNMALFSPNKAAEIESKFPEIKKWVIGGHSMGGAFAAQYAASNKESIGGLFFWAAYPAGSGDLTNSKISVLSVYGSQDGVATPQEVLNGAKLLPSDTVFREITGGNHAQFGSYGAQSGDGEATITREQQQRATVDVTLEFLDSVTAKLKK